MGFNNTTQKNIAGRPDWEQENQNQQRGGQESTWSVWLGYLGWDGHTPWLNIFYIEPDRFTDELTDRGKSP